MKISKMRNSLNQQVKLWLFKPVRASTGTEKNYLQTKWLALSGADFRSTRKELKLKAIKPIKSLTMKNFYKSLKLK